MGFFKRLINLNNIEGCHEAMRASYQKHRKLAEKEKIPTADLSPHQVGLFGALGTRYKVCREPISEASLMGELVPFFLMEEGISIEALAEYAALREDIPGVRKEWLVSTINNALGNLDHAEDDLRTLACMAMEVDPPRWAAILNFSNRKMIDNLISELEQQ